jgi:hypothetical protein
LQRPSLLGPDPSSAHRKRGSLTHSRYYHRIETIHPIEYIPLEIG